MDQPETVFQEFWNVLGLAWMQGCPTIHKFAYDCGVGEETSAHILCDCETLASLRHAYLGSFILEPEDIKSLGLGAIWNYSKVAGLPWFDMGHKGPVLIKA
jgi:hypothetical protein